MLNIANGAWAYLRRKNKYGEDVFFLGNKAGNQESIWGMLEADYEKEAAFITAAPQMYSLLSLIADDPDVSFKYKADVQELVHAIEGKINSIF